ncbi:MAG: hypothetical protein ACE5HU_06555 [Acidobacteriota bacterium]
MGAPAILALIMNGFKFVRKLIAFYKGMPDKNEELIPWLDSVDVQLTESETRLDKYNPEKIV